MQVLVTGAGGFSGSHIVRALIAAGHNVVALTGRKTRGRLQSYSPGPGSLTVLMGDLAENIDFPDGVEAIVHTAATSPGPGIASTDVIRSNVEGTRFLVTWARRHHVSKFINFSSLSVFGRIELPVLDECAPRVDADAYGASKWLGEQILNDQSDAMDSLSIRLPGILGPRPGRHWLATVVEAARSGREITFYHGDADYNNAAHVDDLCRFVDSLLKREWRGHDVIVVAADGTMKVREMVTALAVGLGGRSSLREIAPLRPSFTISIAKAQKLYDYQPMTMRDMIARFVADNND